MSKVEITLNEAGIQELLKSGEMQNVLSTIAREKASAAGPGYGSEVHVFSKRAVAHIFPTTKESAKDNYQNNTLIKVVGV